MTTKDKGRNGGDRPTPKTSDIRNPTGIDPVLGWFNLGKESRIKRQSKRGWKRKSGGEISLELAAILILAVVAGLLLVGVI
jgi:hypothetical protein